jgi:hypothetical protein
MTDPRFTTVIGNHDLQLRRKWYGEDVDLKPAQREAHRELRGEKDAYASYLNRCRSPSTSIRIWSSMRVASERRAALTDDGRFDETANARSGS